MVTAFFMFVMVVIAMIDSCCPCSRTPMIGGGLGTAIFVWSGETFTWDVYIKSLYVWISGILAFLMVLIGFIGITCVRDPPKRQPQPRVIMVQAPPKVIVQHVPMQQQPVVVVQGQEAGSVVS